MIPGVDFDRLLQAGQRVFGVPILVYSAYPPVPARGVFSSRAVDIQEDQGAGIIVVQVITLAIRLADFDVPPDQKMHIAIGGTLYVVSDPPRLDGQGGADLTLKSITQTLQQQIIAQYARHA